MSGHVAPILTSVATAVVTVVLGWAWVAGTNLSGPDANARPETRAVCHLFVAASARIDTPKGQR